MTGIQSHAFGQVRKIEQHRDQLAGELRKALAEGEIMANRYQILIDKLYNRIESMTAEIANQAALIQALRSQIDTLCAQLGDADSRLIDPPAPVCPKCRRKMTKHGGAWMCDNQSCTVIVWDAPARDMRGQRVDD